MPDLKISELPAASALVETDLAPVVQTAGSGLETRRSTMTVLRNVMMDQRPRHVRDFGAVGNGTTDDTAALQAAIDAAAAGGGGVVLLGPRRYLVDSADLIVKSNVTLRGQMDPGGFRPGGNYTTVNFALIVNPSFTVRLRRNSALESCAVLRKGLVAPTSLRTGLDAVKAFAGVGVTMGDGTAGSTAGNGTDSAVRKLLVIGFDTAVFSSAASRTRIEDVVGDCVNGIRVERSFDISHVQRVNMHPLLTTAQSWTNTTYAITGVANNGAGLIRITTGSAHVLVTGDIITISGVTGATGANGRWVVTAVDGTRFDLQGSTAPAAYTGGGTVYAIANRRSGVGFFVTDADMCKFVSCFEYGHETGWQLDNEAHCTQLTNCGADDYSLAGNPIAVCVRITGTATRTKWYGGFWAAKGKALVMNSTATDHHEICGVMMTGGNTGRSVELTDGGLSLVACDLYGEVYLGAGADSCQIIGCDTKTTTFAGASPTAMSRLVLAGNRVAATNSVNRLAGGNVELAAIDSAGAVVPRLTARGDGAVTVHRSSGSSGALLRLNGAGDTTAASLSIAGSDEVVANETDGGAIIFQTRSGGVLAERLRLTAGGALTLSGDPTAALQAATKQYVDGQFTARRLSTLVSGGSIVLTFAAHNNRMVTANPGASLAIDWNSTGDGFACMVYNRTGADLSIFLSNFSASTPSNPDGFTRIRNGGVASLFALSPDGGTTRLLQLSGAGAV
jgi:hypothetical protein